MPASRGAGGQVSPQQFQTKQGRQSWQAAPGLSPLPTPLVERKTLVNLHENFGSGKKSGQKSEGVCACASHSSTGNAGSGCSAWPSRWWQHHPSTCHTTWT